MAHNPAHKPEATRHGGDDETAGEGRDSSGPWAGLGRQEAAENSHKGTAASPPRAELGAAISPPPPLQLAPDGHSRTARPPPPARASCHVAQRRGARHCGAGPSGGPNPRPPPPPPARAPAPRTRASAANQARGPRGRRVNRLPRRRPGREDAGAGATLADPPLPRAGGRPRPHVPLSPPPTSPPHPGGTARAARRLRTPEALTDRRRAPTNSRHLCFHTRREERRPIRGQRRAGSAPPCAGAMAPSGVEPFPPLFALPLRLPQGGPPPGPRPTAPFPFSA